MSKDELSAPTPGLRRRFASRPPADAADSLVGRVVGDRFEILEPLGQGGAGDVYRAVQKALGREVALKVLRPDLDDAARPQFEQRFLREAALAGRLKHPNLVTVHDFGVDHGLQYVVLELLDGRTLQSALRAGPMDPEEAARLGVGVARGLRHAHEQGLVHRDVKPNNVMLVKDDDGREQPKLMDFGLVKSVKTDEDSMTVVGQYLGTPAFMSPEQARGQAVDGRSDLYALGVMLYRMVTGVLPFEADHPLAMALLHQNEPVPRMAERAPGVKVPLELENLIRRAMAKKPEDRWPDALAFADALEAWLNRRTRPTLTLPPPEVLVEGKQRWGILAVLATLASVLAGAVLLLVGVTGLAIGWWSGQPPVVADPELPAEVAPAPVAEVVPEPAPDPAPEPEPAPDPEPAPAPVALPAPPPEPAPVVSPKPAPVASPKPSPAPDPKPAPEPVSAVVAPPGGVVVDEVPLTAGEAAALLAYVNAASPDALGAAGVYDRGVGVILQGRPFASVEAFGATPGIGKKTVEACRDASR